QMDAAAEAAAGDVLELTLQLLELLLHRRPVVDDQEDVGKPVLAARGACCASSPHCGRRVDAQLLEAPFPFLQQGADLANRAAHALRVVAAAGAAHVREAGQRAERAATVVHAVELRLPWSVGQGKRADK